ncbi:cell envelope biogenesis protein TolA [Pelagibacteraceae bacterium]|nr:cell envelope biogenesis protein TolA [Pelagibacteraceae bacterium]
MNRNVVISFGLHTLLVIITAMSLPFLAKKPIDLPPIISVELIQISDKTNIPFAPKAKKIIEKVKEKEKKLVSEQAPPKKVKKTKTKTVVSLDKKLEKIDKQKPESIPLPEKTVKKIETKKETKQNPEKVVTEVKQVSEFEKEELFDPTELKAKIDKAKIDSSKEKVKKTNQISQDKDMSIVTGKLTITEEQALQAQILVCWSIPLGLPYVPDDMLVKIELNLRPDGQIEKMEMLDHAKMNTPGKETFKTIAESVMRALRNPLCNPLRMPATGYERWKKIIFNFDATEQLGGNIKS